MKILTLLLLATSAFAQPKERAPVKTLSDGFQPDPTRVKLEHVSSIAAMPLEHVTRTTPRLKSEEQVVELTGTITRIAHEADGDYHIEIADGTLDDSTVVCEAVDPRYSTESAFLPELEAARLAAKRLRVGERMTFVGLEFQDIPHSPSPMRTRNFREIHPVLYVRRTR